MSGAEAQYPYDALVLAPGAAAIKPPLPGVDLPGIFQMKTVPDRWGAGPVKSCTPRASIPAFSSNWQLGGVLVPVDSCCSHSDASHNSRLEWDKIHLILPTSIAPPGKLSSSVQSCSQVEEVCSAAWLTFSMRLQPCIAFHSPQAVGLKLPLGQQLGVVASQLAARDIAPASSSGHKCLLRQPYRTAVRATHFCSKLFAGAMSCC